MLRAVTVALLFSLAVPAEAETLLSEASGNWAGASNQGFYFLARLTQNEDAARLVIWGGAMDGVPSGEGEPEFDNPEIALGAFATRQELEVIDTSAGSILQIVTEYADEESEGRSVLQIQYLDTQYTVVGYFHADDGVGGHYECDIDFLRGVATQDGVERRLSEMAVDELNASDWTFNAAFDRGYCS